MNRLTWLFALSLLFSSTVWAANWQSAQQRWAEIQYRLPPDQQSAAMQVVIDELDAELSKQPKQVEALIWRGIAEATLAGYQGGLGALSLLRDARRDLEAAIAIDEHALNGAAHTSLGSLYYQVPGWPISFGSNSKAEAELKKGVESQAKAKLLQPLTKPSKSLQCLRCWRTTLTWKRLLRRAAKPLEKLSK